MSDVPAYHGPGPADVRLPVRTTSIIASAAIIPIDTVMQMFCVHCVEGTNMLNTDGYEFKNFDTALAILTEQEGCVAIYWGPLAHDTTCIQILVGWRTHAHSKNFRDQSPDHALFCHHLTLISREVPYTAPTYHFRAHPTRPFSFPPNAQIYQVSHFYTIAPQSGPNESFAHNLESYLRIITPDINGPYEGAFARIIDLEERRDKESEHPGEEGGLWGECMIMLIPWPDLGQWLRMVLSDVHEYAVPFTLWGREHDDMMFTLFRHYWTTSADADVPLLELDAS